MCCPRKQRAPLLWSLVARSNGDREQLWGDLASDPATAYRGQWGLAGADGLAAFLRAKVGGPVPRSEAERIAQLVAGLDDNSFRARETAQAELVRLGRVAEPAVRTALGRAASGRTERAAGKPRRPLRQRAVPGRAPLAQGRSSPDLEPRSRGEDTPDTVGVRDGRAHR